MPRKNLAPLITITLMQNRYMQVSLHSIMSQFIETLLHHSSLILKLCRSDVMFWRQGLREHKGEALSAFKWILQEKNLGGWKCKPPYIPRETSSCLPFCMQCHRQPHLQRHLAISDVLLLCVPTAVLPKGLLPTSHRAVSSLPCPGQPFPQISLAERVFK